MSRTLGDLLVGSIVSPFTSTAMCPECGCTLPEEMRDGHVPDAMDAARRAPQIPTYRGGGSVCGYCNQEMSPHMVALNATVNGPGSRTYKQMTALKVVQQPLVK